MEFLIHSLIRRKSELKRMIDLLHQIAERLLFRLKTAIQTAKLLLKFSLCSHVLILTSSSMLIVMATAQISDMLPQTMSDVRTAGNKAHSSSPD